MPMLQMLLFIKVTYLFPLNILILDAPTCFESVVSKEGIDGWTTSTLLNILILDGNAAADAMASNGQNLQSFASHWTFL